MSHLQNCSLSRQMILTEFAPLRLFNAKELIAKTLIYMQKKNDLEKYYMNKDADVLILLQVSSHLEQNLIFAYIREMLTKQRLLGKKKYVSVS